MSCVGIAVAMVPADHVTVGVETHSFIVTYCQTVASVQLHWILPVTRCTIRRIPIRSGSWWLIGRFVAFRPKGHGFESIYLYINLYSAPLESRSICHVGTLGKCFTRCWRAVSGAPLSSSGLEEALYRNSLNE